jgi:hypothetical protein
MEEYSEGLESLHEIFEEFFDLASVTIGLTKGTISSSLTILKTLVDLNTVRTSSKRSSCSGSHYVILVNRAATAWELIVPYFTVTQRLLESKNYSRMADQLSSRISKPAGKTLA